MSTAERQHPAAQRTTVTTTVDGSVGWIKLDGAARLNAIGTPTYQDIAAAISDFESKRRVRAVVVHGAGRVFSAGADIAEIGTFSDRGRFERFIHGFTDALEVIESSTLPVIAAIHGAALGGGLELALACDLRLSTPTAKLGLPEAKLGVLPGAGGTQRLPRLIPPGIATEMLITGDPISGQRAYEIGLVNALSDPATLITDAGSVAGRLAEGSAQVSAAAKSLLRTTSTQPLDSGIASERAVAADLFDSRDGREGFSAFLAKRPPNFTPED